jgi:hypothetical protein
MLSSVRGEGPGIAVPYSNPSFPQSSEVFAVSLDKETLNVLMEAVAKAGLDPGRVQVSASPQTAEKSDWRQLFTTRSATSEAVSAPVQQTAAAPQSATLQESKTVQASSTPAPTASGRKVEGRLNSYDLDTGASGRGCSVLDTAPGGRATYSCLDFTPTYEIFNFAGMPQVQRGFATRETAEKLAAFLGGKAVLHEPPDVLPPFEPTPPQWFIELGGVEINAGFAAELYAKYPKEYADLVVQRDVRYTNNSFTLLSKVVGAFPKKA